MTFAILIVLLAVGLFGLQLFSLKWGLAWTKIATISLFKAFLYSLLFGIVAAIVGAVLEVALARVIRPLSELESTVFVVVLQSIAAVVFFAIIYRTTIALATRAALPFFAITFIPSLFAILVIRPFVYEAYFVPTNSMAPTLLGEHLTGKCPRCGHNAYGFAPESTGRFSVNEVPMICSHELKSCLVENPSNAVESGDRFMVSKLTTPRR